MSWRMARRFRRDGDAIQRGEDRGKGVGAAGVVAVPIVAQTVSKRGRTAARLHLQRHEPPPVSEARVCVALANDPSQAGQRLRLVVPGLHDVGRCQPAGQSHIEMRPRVAHHHLAKESAQLFTTAGVGERLDAPEVTTELSLGAQQPWLQEQNEIVQLREVVADRRRAEEQQEPLLEIVDELPTRRRAVLERVRLVDDHQVVVEQLEPVAVCGLTRQRQ